MEAVKNKGRLPLAAGPSSTKSNTVLHSDFTIIRRGQIWHVVCLAQNVIEPIAATVVQNANTYL